MTGTPNAITVRTIGGPIDERRSPEAALTLAAAVRRTLATSPTLQAALSRVQAAAADAEQARLLPNPVFSVSMRFPEAGGSPIIDAGLAADLLSILRAPGRARAADRRLRAASGDALSTVLDVLSEVQETYVNVQALDEQVAVLEKRRELIGRLLELSRVRQRAGEGTKLDVITLDSQRVELEADMASALLDRTEQRLKLARLLGDPSGGTAWELEKWHPAPPVVGSESAWIAAALANRPQIQARRWELAALGDEVALAGWFIFEGSDVGITSERDQTWSLGPAVTTPLPAFDWGQARTAKARAGQAEARHKLTEALRQGVEDVRRSYAAFHSSLTPLSMVQTQLIPMAEERRRLAEAAYKLGEADLVTLLQAEQDLQTARSRLVDLQKQTSIALFRLQRTVGGPGVAERSFGKVPTPTQRAGSVTGAGAAGGG
jgi:outer membrane protein TolC